VEHMTVVYSITDPDAFKAEWARLHPLFLAEKEAPFSIRSISRDDEMRV
jgi:hypothetical protein